MVLSSTTQTFLSFVLFFLSYAPPYVARLNHVTGALSPAPEDPDLGVRRAPPPLASTVIDGRVAGGATPQQQLDSPYLVSRGLQLLLELPQLPELIVQDALPFNDGGEAWSSKSSCLWAPNRSSTGAPARVLRACLRGWLASEDYKLQPPPVVVTFGKEPSELVQQALLGGLGGAVECAVIIRRPLQLFTQQLVGDASGVQHPDSCLFGLANNRALLIKARGASGVTLVMGATHPCQVRAFVMLGKACGHSSCVQDLGCRIL